MTRGHRSIRPRARWAGALLFAATAGGHFAACGGAPAAAPHGRPAVLTASQSTKASKPTSKKSTLPQCSAPRDPFDPTDSKVAPNPTTC